MNDWSKLSRQWWISNWCCGNHLFNWMLNMGYNLNLAMDCINLIYVRQPFKIR